ncbi:MAG: hypothetical protein GY793_10000 [Proteobacteria bacterium]|nr:hypothetical protein [Pseudomonadota bacterium]
MRKIFILLAAVFVCVFSFVGNARADELIKPFLGLWSTSKNKDPYFQGNKIIMSELGKCNEWAGYNVIFDNSRNALACKCFDMSYVTDRQLVMLCTEGTLISDDILPDSKIANIVKDAEISDKTTWIYRFIISSITNNKTFSKRVDIERTPLTPECFNKTLSCPTKKHVATYWQ